MKITSLDDLYATELRDLYSAENQIMHNMPQVLRAITSEGIAKAVKLHIEQTKGQVRRLETIFEDLQEKPAGHKCKAMEGLLLELDESLKDIKPGLLLDAAIVGGLSRIEHYELAGYGAALSMAKHLGHKNHAVLIKETLNEEHTTSKDLAGFMAAVLEEFEPAADKD